MKEELRKTLDKEWYDKLPNMKCPHKKMIIGFSDIPGSGLTEDLSVKIAERYNGVWVPKDKARTLIYENEKIESVQQAENLTDEYMDIFLERIVSEPNGLLVINAGVDRKYEFYRDWAKLNGYEMFIISFIVNRERVMERVRKDRDEETANWFEDQLDRWYGDQEKFNDLYGANFYIEDNNQEQIKELFREIDKKLA